MGWDLGLYVVDTSVGHETDKTCWGYDREPDLDPDSDPETNPDPVTNLDQTCAKCMWFRYRVAVRPYIVVEYQIHHAYANEITGSKYCIRDLLIGTRLDEDEGVDIWTLRDVEAQLAEYGPLSIDQNQDPDMHRMRRKDRLALQEAVKVLEWARSWLSRSEHYRILRTGD